MATIEITTNDTGGVVLFDPIFEHGTLTFAGAETWPAGTVLGRLTATGFMTRYDSGGAGGAEIPKAVTTQEIISTGAGDVPFSYGIAGRYKAGDLTEFGVGVITIAQQDQLRDFSIISSPTKELGELDNL